MRQNVFLCLLTIVLFFNAVNPGGGYSNVTGVEDGDSVVLDYVLTVDNATVENNTGIILVVSNNTLIIGFYEGILGMRIGDRKNITVPPEKGYASGDLAGKTVESDLDDNIQTCTSSQLTSCFIEVAIIICN